MARKQTGSARIPPKLSEAEQDLVSHMEKRFQLETSEDKLSTAQIYTGV